MKLKLLCVILCVCGFSLVVSGSDSESTSSEPSPDPVPVPSAIEHLEGLANYFKAAEERDREQSTVIEELKEQLKSLSDKFEKFKEEISSDHGVWLLTPPLRGPPGRDGAPESKVDEVPPDPQPRSLKSCSDAMEILPSPRSQKQWIYPNANTTKIQVLCDFESDGGGWTVIQKRSFGPRRDFNRTWNEYENGFGSLSGNFWLGLENIYALTKNGDQELRIELEDFEGEKKWAKYSNFAVSDASGFYRLRISGFSRDSTAGDSMADGEPNNGMKFSTKDKDNDPSSLHCANYLEGGGWWFHSCGYSNLNGLYLEKEETVSHQRGIFWQKWKGWTYSLSTAEMKIRTRKSP